MACCCAFGENACAQVAPHSAVHTGHLGAPSDSTGQLRFVVHPRQLGWSATPGAEAGGPTFNGTARAALESRHVKGHVTWEFLQGAGLPMDIAVESGFDRRHGSGALGTRLLARWEARLLPSVGMAIGRDTLHDGWGGRSLFRGRHAAPVPFLETRMDGGGRLRYRHRIEALQGAPSIACWTGMEGDPRDWVPATGPMRTGIERMVVSHRLEVDFGKRLTGVLWGAVVWNTNSGARTFEPHYLLPLTSLRPTEYAQGSSDNAIVGMEGRFELGADSTRQRYLYGQLMLDELIVDEILNSTGWWGNKYGLLGGIHWDWKRGDGRLELCGVRPWSYSHFTPTSAYIHGLTPLAHPLGANFLEGRAQGRIRRGEWRLTGRVTASRRGDDTAGDTPTGSRPQVGDIDRTAETYTWLNGTARELLLIQCDAARLISIGDHAALQGFIRGEFQRMTLGEATGDEWRLMIGLRSTGPLLGGDW